MARASTLTRTEAIVQIDNLDDLTQSIEWFNALLPVTARDELQKEQARGNLRDPVSYVDGKKNPNIDAVKPFGTISYVEGSGPLAEAIAAADVFVRTYAPRDTGHYDRALQWFANGRNAGGRPDAKRVGLRGNVQLVDLAPYASTLEIEVPRGLIYGAYTFLSRLFGRTLSIGFSYAMAYQFGGFIEKPGNPAITHYAVPVLTMGNPASTVKRGARGTPAKTRGKRRRSRADYGARKDFRR